jgi:hypothetical protein
MKFIHDTFICQQLFPCFQSTYSVSSSAFNVFVENVFSRRESLNCRDKLGFE